MLHDEEILTFAEAAKTLPRINGKRLHASSLWRWARKGLFGCKLETRRVGGRFVTSREALERFTRALSEIPPQSRRKPQIKPTFRTARQREQAIAEAQRTLDKAGI